MPKKVILINGNKPSHFAAIFEESSSNYDVSSTPISSSDCIISVGYESKQESVCIVENNNILSTEDSAFLIKRTNKDTYRTYLIGRILSKQAVIFADEANLLSDKSADKITMTTLLPFEGVGVPKSIITTAESYKKNYLYISKHVTYPAVIKKAGSKGKSVWKVTNETELEERLNQDNELSLIQEYIPNDHDFRVFVIDGQVVTSIKRTSADGFYNNVSQGGTATYEEITDEEKAICIKSAAVAKLRLAGVDMVRTPNGPLVFEVNKSPQLDIFSPAAGFDIEKVYSEKVLEFLTRSSK